MVEALFILFGAVVIIALTAAAYFLLRDDDDKWMDSFCGEYRRWDDEDE